MISVIVFMISPLSSVAPELVFINTIVQFGLPRVRRGDGAQGRNRRNNNTDHYNNNSDNKQHYENNTTDHYNNNSDNNISL